MAEDKQQQQPEHPTLQVYGSNRDSFAVTALRNSAIEPIRNQPNSPEHDGDIQPNSPEHDGDIQGAPVYRSYEQFRSGTRPENPAVRIQQQPGPKVRTGSKPKVNTRPGNVVGAPSYGGKRRNKWVTVGRGRGGAYNQRPMVRNNYLARFFFL